MRKILIIGTVLLVSLHLASIQVAANDEPFTVGVSVDLTSTYYWRGFNVTDDHPAIQPTLAVRHNRSGLFFEFWSSHALSNRSDFAEADEYDFTLGWDFSLGSQAGLTLGAIAYVYPRLEREEDLSREFFAGLYLVDVPLNPSVTYYRDIDLGDGGYLELGASRCLGDLALGADLGFSFEQYTPRNGLSDVVLKAAYTIPIGAEGSIAPFVNLAVVNDSARNPDDTVFWFGVTLAWEH